MADWVRYPLPLFRALPPWRACKWRCPRKGYLSDTCAICPMIRNKAKRVRYRPSAILSRKGIARPPFSLPPPPSSTPIFPPLFCPFFAPSLHLLPPFSPVILPSFPLPSHFFSPFFQREKGWKTLGKGERNQGRRRVNQGPLNGGVSNGGVSRSGFVLPFFVLFCPFLSFPGDFPDLRGDGPGIFLICPFPLSQPIKSTYEEQSRKGPRHNLDLSRKKWETPGFGNTPV